MWRIPSWGEGLHDNLQWKISSHHEHKRRLTRCAGEPSMPGAFQSSTDHLVICDRDRDTKLAEVSKYSCEYIIRDRDRDRDRDGIVQYYWAEKTILLTGTHRGTHTYTQPYVCVYIYMYVCMYVCMYLCITDLRVSHFSCLVTVHCFCTCDKNKAICT